MHCNLKDGAPVILCFDYDIMLLMAVWKVFMVVVVGLR